MGANYRSAIQVPVPLMPIVNFLREAELRGRFSLDLRGENPTATNVWFHFHHGVTFSSWGENITVIVTPISDSLTSIDCFSECSLPTQIVDMGKNKQNVTNILNYIHERLACSPASQPAPATAAPAVEKKFCFHCGNKLQASDAFCPACGTKQS